MKPAIATLAAATAALVAAVAVLAATTSPQAAPPPARAPEGPNAPFDGPVAAEAPQLAVWREPRRWEPPRPWPITLAADARVALYAHGAELTALATIPPWEERKPPPPPPPPKAPAPAPAQPAPAPPPRAPNPGVEAWRSLVAAYFPAENVEIALLVMWCESRGDPGADNPTSTAAGLFQFLQSTWDWIAVPLGYGTYASGAVYDPTANIHAASALSNGGTTWRAWTASRGCWG